jgi:hypothetical protein
VTIYPLRRAARWEAKVLGLLGDHEAMRYVSAHWSVDLQIKAVRSQAAARARAAERARAVEVARWEEVRDNLMARVRLSDAAEVRLALREAGVALPPRFPAAAPRLSASPIGSGSTTLIPSRHQAAHEPTAPANALIELIGT